MKKFGLTILLLAFFSGVSAQSEKIKIAKLQYSGGGDWYANKTALPNLAKFCNEQLGTTIDEENAVVTVGSPELFNYAFVYMTGHGNVVFSPSEAENLRKYLTSGGFLHIDDNYGLNDYIRLEMKKVFPELEFIELPHDHPIYHQKFDFPNGIPKIHEHDNKPAQGFGLIYEGKLVCYFSYESDLGNGWEDQRIHNDPEEVRLKALRMGANLLTYVFTEL
ncbi:DUF4159 domain-containing protein [Roseivirga sp.]|jgi:hypothetical protein|uniref:DUF4159 domain-containing protein n=1 Tax=Roseivirga sp. TaxID=1964215 RepID=UPI000D7AE025|nr:DUF4159 domain-containing protein [Roseivirga sp.]MBO6659381.1 DUF4159 domain-containing protein [Roseivirga sp.]MBO6759746.1 DUF4159 domain-containing protein [Roseivirga sp.]MBO6907882.1 DUF4159 domain-containing protein [Roseivirga sp.]PWL28423.1 MAG: hypothetical protein DCO95_13730 [Roseivirga sp. XM-24bin3]